MEDLWGNTVKFVAQPAIATSLLQMLAEPELGSKSWVYEQYDHMLFLNTVVGPGHDATLLRVKGTNRGLALSTDGNGRMCYLDPRRGAARLVYEAALNVAVVGAEPLAVVDNLNFGNPEKPEVMWQFRETVEGLAEACEALGIPVIGGNVSFYNETDGLDIYPTPVVGMLGSRRERARRPHLGSTGWKPGWTSGFSARNGRSTWPARPSRRSRLPMSVGDRRHPIRRWPKPPLPRPANWPRQGCPPSTTYPPVGPPLAVAEMCIASGVGATVAYSDWRHLFCEDPHRFLVAATPEQGHNGRIDSQRHRNPRRPDRRIRWNRDRLRPSRRQSRPRPGSGNGAHGETRIASRLG